jgi:hypothetical protein
MQKNHEPGIFVTTTSNVPEQNTRKSNRIMELQKNLEPRIFATSADTSESSPDEMDDESEVHELNYHTTKTMSVVPSLSGMKFQQAVPLVDHLIIY